MAAQSNPVRILLVDDHKVLRDGLRALLECEPDLQVIGEAGTGAQAIALAGTLAPDVMVLDLGLPDINGLEVMRTLREFPGAVVEVTGDLAPARAERSLLLGASLLAAALAGLAGLGLSGVVSARLVRPLQRLREEVGLAGAAGGAPDGSASMRCSARVMPSTSILPPAFWNASMSASIASRVTGVRSLALRGANRWLVFEGAIAGGAAPAGCGFFGLGMTPVS